MYREIVLSSYNVKDQGNFITKFNRPIILDRNSEYEVGLNRIMNMSFTWYNVNPPYANQLIKYGSDNGSTFLTSLSQLESGLMKNSIHISKI